MTLTPAVFDGIVIATVLISGILAMVRGFVREILSVAAWVAAAAAAYFLYQPFSPVLETVIEDANWRNVASAAIIFFVALIIASYVTMKVSNMIVDGRVNMIDRIMGFAFGVARGVLILTIAYLFLDGVLPENPAWIAEARTQPILADVGEWLVSVLPPDMENTLREWLSGQNSTLAPLPEGVPPGAATPGVVPTGAPVPPGEVGPGYGDGARGAVDQLFGNGAGAPR
jgi:membrane protein required for colicin V production